MKAPNPLEDTQPGRSLGAPSLWNEPNHALMESVRPSRGSALGQRLSERPDAFGRVLSLLWRALVWARAGRPSGEADARPDRPSQPLRPPASGAVALERLREGWARQVPAARAQLGAASQRARRGGAALASRVRALPGAAGETQRGLRARVVPLLGACHTRLTPTRQASAALAARLRDLPALRAAQARLAAALPAGFLTFRRAAIVALLLTVALLALAADPPGASAGPTAAAEASPGRVSLAQPLASAAAALPSPPSESVELSAAPRALAEPESGAPSAASRVPTAARAAELDGATESPGTATPPAPVEALTVAALADRAEPDDPEPTARATNQSARRKRLAQRRARRAARARARGRSRAQAAALSEPDSAAPPSAKKRGAAKRASSTERRRKAAARRRAARRATRAAARAQRRSAQIQRREARSTPDLDAP